MRRAFLIVLLSSLPMLLLAQKKAPTAAVMAAGKTIYTQRCMTCHQVDGTGAQNMIPPLIKTDYVVGSTAPLIKILLNGLTGQIKVNGDVYEGEMPSHAFLTDDEVAAVLSYVRNSFGNEATAVTTDEVKKMRATLKK